MTLREVNRLVKRIQQTLVLPTEPDEDELIELSGQHEDYVETVTDRLEQIASYLDRGLLSEAIDLAEIEPNVSETVAVLDFPECDDWNILLNRHRVQGVPSLPLDVIELLNDAYTRSASAEKLVQRFRTLSLARAPIGDRIEVLKRLAKRDPENDLWAENVAVYEDHRLKGLQDELDKLTQDKDLAGLAKLNSVLHEEWTVPVPASLKEEVTAAYRELQAVESRLRLAPIADKLSAAFSEFDLEEAKRLLPQYRELEESARLPANHDITIVANPAIQWIENELAKEQQQEQRDSAIQDLERELNNPNSSHDRLQAIYTRATSTGEAVPPELEARLADRIKADAAAAGRKRTASIVGLIAFVALAAVGIGYAIYHMNFNSEVRTHAERLGGLMKTAEQVGDLTGPNDYLSQLQEKSPAVLTTPEFVDLKSQLAALGNSEANRVARIEELIESAKPAASGASWALFEPAYDNLDAAMRLVKNNNEKARVEAEDIRIRAAEANLQKTADGEFTVALTEVTNELETAADDLSKLTPAIEKLRGLTNQGHVSNALRQKALTLLDQSDERRSVMLTNIEIANDLEKITASVGDEAKFAETLRLFCTSHPKAARSSDFRIVESAERKLWTAVSEFNALLDQFRDIKVTDITSGVARSLVNRYEDYVAEYGEYPAPTLLEERLAALKAIAAREPEDDEAISRTLENIFESPLMRDCYFLARTDGKTFYCKEAPDVRASSIRLEFFEDTVGKRQSGDSVRLDLAVKPYVQLSAQSKAIPAIERAIENLEVDFETSMTTIVESILDPPNIDPVLQLLLVEALLQIGSKGSLFIQQECAEGIEAMAAVDISRASNWVVPTDELDRERKLARREMAKINTVIRNGLSQAKIARDQAFKKDVAPRMKWVGWLHKDMTQKWTVALPEEHKLASESPLYCFHLDQNGDPQRTQVGSVAGGLILFKTDTLSGSTTREGRPVYIESSEQ